MSNDPIVNAADAPEKKKPGPKPGTPRPPRAADAEIVRNAEGHIIDTGITVLKDTPEYGTKEYADYVARMRDVRKPFGDFTQKLARPPRVGYYRVWINDEPGRIQQARNAGYVHVKDPATGKAEVFTVNPRSKDAASQFAYLMEIPQEIWELDQIAKHKRADEMEAAIRKSKVIAASGSEAKEDEGGFYVPGSGSKVETIGGGRS